VAQRQQGHFGTGFENQLPRATATAAAATDEERAGAGRKWAERAQWLIKGSRNNTMCA
jgi:hypothetical protein